MTPSPLPPGTSVRLGAIVPPANPAAEPELHALTGAAAVLHIARLPVLAGDLRARCEGYGATYPEAVRAFGELDLAAIGIAFMSATYRDGPEADAALCRRLSEAAGCPVATASLAVTEALRALGARRIALVSPYPDWLTEWSRGYWREGGFEVAALTTMGDVFRAYDASEDELAGAIAAVGATAADAVLLTGTGAYTLGALARVGDTHSRCYLTSNLCLAWWLMRSAGLPQAPLLASLNPALAATRG
ncbi:maleate cis-trans isomerase family protein [Elioraea sp.]|uniref:maleate cis-trans isomerase family protein n=1 Tax=Elioraea sp. TaxID=2185103 RepID=UPI003F6E4858